MSPLTSTTIKLVMLQAVFAVMYANTLCKTRIFKNMHKT